MLCNVPLSLQRHRQHVSAKPESRDDYSKQRVSRNRQKQEYSHLPGRAASFGPQPHRRPSRKRAVRTASVVDVSSGRVFHRRNPETRPDDKLGSTSTAHSFEFEDFATASSLLSGTRGRRNITVNFSSSSDSDIDPNNVIGRPRHRADRESTFESLQKKDLFKKYSDFSEPQGVNAESKIKGEELGKNKEYIITRLEASKQISNVTSSKVIDVVDPTVGPQVHLVKSSELSAVDAMTSVETSYDQVERAQKPPIDTNWSLTGTPAAGNIPVNRSSQFSNSSTEAPDVPPKTKEAYQPYTDSSSTTIREISENKQVAIETLNARPREVSSTSGDVLMRKPASSLRDVYSSQRQSSSSFTKVPPLDITESGSSAETFPFTRTAELNSSDPDTFRSSGYGSYSSKGGKEAAKANQQMQSHSVKSKGKNGEEKEHFRDSIRELDEYLKSQPGGESDTESVQNFAGLPLKFSELETWHF